MRIPELLAPAPDFAGAQAAFGHGADAVYIGVGPYNLRAHATSIEPEELDELLAYAHGQKKKVLVALNTMPDDAAISAIEILLKKITKNSELPDAIIISDPALLVLCRKLCPSISLHLSTQTGTFNSAAMKFWKEQGISRIILPREFTLQQIKDINARGICETEIFIHGAMCVSVSGRCLLGAYLTGRHANKGDCPQPCRLRYQIKPVEKGVNYEEYFDAEESNDGVYLLNSRDLNSISLLPRIVETNVASVKIEGRNKSIHYISSVVKVYREALDSYQQNPSSYSVKPSWTKELDLVEHRPYTTGFYGGEYQLQDLHSVKAPQAVRVVGLVREVMADNRAVIEVKNPFLPGESLNVLPKKRGQESYDISINEIKDLDGNSISRAITNRLVTIQGDIEFRIGDILRRIVRHDR